MVRRHREISGIAVLRRDAPQLHEGLIGAALPLVIASAVGGTTALVLLVVRRYWAVRVVSVSAVVAVVCGWAVGQYPFLLRGQVTIDEAAHPATMQAVLVSLIIGGMILLPSLLLLFWLFQHSAPQVDGDDVTQQLPVSRAKGG